VIDYRDDNRHLWQYIEDSDDEEFFDDPEKQNRKPAEVQSLPPRRYPEWDCQSQTYRPDWASVYEALHPSGNAADIDRLLEKHAALAKRLKRLLDLLKPQDKVRIRYQEEGSDLDLDIALSSLIDYRSGATPDPRINMSHRTDGRSIDVLLLLDLSESLNQKVGAGGTAGQTVLELSQEAVSLLAWAIDHLGDAYAIAGFPFQYPPRSPLPAHQGLFRALGRHGQSPPGRHAGRLVDTAWARRCATPATTSSIAVPTRRSCCC
jgi:nitric oxide reductase NorD protein